MMSTICSYFFKKTEIMLQSIIFGQSYDPKPKYMYMNSYLKIYIYTQLKKEITPYK